MKIKEFKNNFWFRVSVNNTVLTLMIIIEVSSKKDNNIIDRVNTPIYETNDWITDSNFP